MEKKNLLVLDNTTSIVSPWKGELRKYFNLIEAVGGFEALAKLRENKFSVAIINLSIRSFDGIDALKKIREKEPQLPIVVIADKSDIKFVKDAARYGIHGYFFIPVETSDILALILKITNTDLSSVIQQAEKNGQEKLDKQSEENSKKEIDVVSLYYEAQGYFARGEIDKAIKIFNDIINIKHIKDTWRKYIEESIFHLARCYIKLNNIQKAIELLNIFIQRAPNSEYNKTAYFVLAECYESINETSKAIEIYKKLMNMPPFDAISTRARKKLKALSVL
jgi:DNA-binding NarL/FixJ family response regulator